MKKTKAPVLWTVRCEGVDKSGWQRRGIIRDTRATQRNKWQHKRTKTDDRTTLNVNHGLIDGTQGAKQKIKVFPRVLKINRFHWLLKIR